MPQLRIPCAETWCSQIKKRKQATLLVIPLYQAFSAAVKSGSWEEERKSWI